METFDITSESFYKEFLKYWDCFKTENPDWRELYWRDKDWTIKFLSPPISSETDSPFGNYIKKSFPNLRYRSEDGSIDLAFAKKNCFYSDRIQALDGVKVSDYFWPKEYEIILEHENNIKSSWQELLKLSYIKSYLKVLITYNSSMNRDKIINQNSVMQNNLNIVKNIDNEDTLYLIIIGSLTSSDIIWEKII